MPTIRTARVSIFRPSGLVFLFARSLLRYFVTGQSVLGRPTDNASFLHAATKDNRGKPTERLSGPLWQRLARRWAALGLPLFFLALAALSTAVRALFGSAVPLVFRIPWARVALWWEIVAVCLVAGFGTMLFASYWRQRKQISEFVYPAWQAACAVMGTGYHKRDARKMVELPEGFEVDDEPGETLLGRIADRVWRDRRNAAALARVEQEAEHAADPSTEIVVRPKSVVARYLGRRLDEESQAPRELPEPPPVRIFLLPGKVTNETERKRFVASVGSVLGMPDAKPTWYARGRRPFVELRPNVAPPAAVSFAQILRYLDAAGLTNPFMGLGAGNHAISIDLDNNSPHTMISGGSGTGKSVLLKNFLAQRMHNGAGVVMLDYKRVSHRWMHNLPGCDYAWRLGDVHDKLCAAGEELGRRLETVLPEDNAIDAEMQIFPTIDIVVEEINSTMKLLTAYWQTVLGGTGTSPAVTALMTLVNMGREYRMHVWIAAQRASASIFGANGGDLRESFQTRLLAKWSVQTWKMLAGNTQYQRPIGGRGVWARVQDDEIEIVRVPFWTNDEARGYAMSGVQCPADPLPGGAYIAAGHRTEQADIGPRLVTLSASIVHLPADSRGKTLSISGLRTASRRPGFPAPLVVGESTRPSLYDLDALIAWRANAVGEVGQLDEMFEQPPAVRDLRRRGIVYACDTLNTETGAIEIGYVGQTRRTLAEREAEHRGNKPWADLIVGNFRVVWEGEPTDEELDAIEKKYIRDLRPRYNIEHNMGKSWSVPKWVQLEARHRRDDELGRPHWYPVDVYNGQRRPEALEEWRRDD